MKHETLGLERSRFSSCTGQTVILNDKTPEDL